MACKRLARSIHIPLLADNSQRLKPCRAHSVYGSPEEASLVSPDQNVGRNVPERKQQGGQTRKQPRVSTRGNHHTAGSVTRRHATEMSKITPFSLPDGADTAYSVPVSNAFFSTSARVKCRKGGRKRKCGF